MKAENSGNSAEVPGVDSWGWFEPVLSPAPESWPWALPNLYAVNIAPDPGVEIVGGSASPDGDLNVVTSFVRDRTRIEEIGFWRGTFGLVRRRRHPSRKDAEKEALDSFNVLRAKYLMRSGKVVEENDQVTIIGDWPPVFSFASLRDLGVFCAFIYEKAIEGGAKDEAVKFRESIRLESTGTEQLVTYIKSLELGQSKLETYLSPADRSILWQAHQTARGWLR